MSKQQKNKKKNRNQPNKQTHKPSNKNQKPQNKQQTSKQDKAVQTIKTQQLTMGKVKREAKEAHVLEEYVLNNDNDTIKFYPIFPGGKIDEVLDELHRDVHYANKNEIDLTKDDAFFISYTLFLCVKHFTSLKDGISDSVEDKIQQFKYLKDAGYYNQIVNEVFMTSEINKVIQALSESLGTQKFVQQIEERTTDYVKTLEFKNKEMMDNLNRRIAESESKLKQ